MTISRRRIISRIRSYSVDPILEWLDAEAAHGIDEALLFVSLLHIDVYEFLNRVRNGGLWNRRPDDLAERRVFGCRTADGDLVPLFTVLIDTENADVSDVMMAARVHATGHLDLYLAEIVEVVEITEVGLNLLGYWNRGRVGKRAKIEPRATDHVGECANVRRGELQCIEGTPQLIQVFLPYIRQQQVLVV